jgi:hypothetical protein
MTSKKSQPKSLPEKKARPRPKPDAKDTSLKSPIMPRAKQSKTQKSATDQAAKVNDHRRAKSTEPVNAASQREKPEIAKRGLVGTSSKPVTAQKAKRIATPKTGTSLEKLQDQLKAGKKEIAELKREKELLIAGFRDTFSLAEQDNADLTQQLRACQYELNQAKSALAQKKVEADETYFRNRRLETDKFEQAQREHDLKSQLATSLDYGNKLAEQIERLLICLDKAKSMPPVPYRVKRSQNQKIVEAAGIVDNSWYLQTYPDVSALGINPTLHYVSHGAAEGRSPSPEHKALRDVYR